MTFSEWKKAKRKNTQTESGGGVTPSSPAAQASQADSGAEVKPSFSEWKKKNRPSVSVDDQYISTFVSDASSFFEGLEKDRASYYEQSDRVKDLATRYDTIQNWLSKNKSKLDEKTYKELSSAFEGIGSGLTGIQDYYAQWNDRDEYLIWDTKEKFVKNYMDDPEGAEAGKYGYYDDEWMEEAKQRALLESEDFAYYSQIGAGIENPSYGDATGFWQIGNWRPFGEEVGNMVTFSRDNADEIAKRLAMSNGNGDTSTVLGDYRYQFMTDNEVAIYNYYLGKGDKEKADEYLASIDDELTHRFENQAVENTRQMANDFPVLSSVMSPLVSLGSGFEYITDLATGDDRNTAADMNAAIRGTVSEKVNWEIGNWDAFDFVYNTTMSGVDSLTAGAVFGPAGGGVVLGLSAAGQATNDALDRGLSKDQAFWNGISAGVFEGLFERVSLGQLSALKEVPAASVKELAKNIGKSMLVNASEETLTEIANITYDIIANGDFSNYEVTIRYYMEQGMSESEAKTQAALDLAGQVVEAGASGALMGAGFGGLGNASQLHNTKNIYGENSSDLVTEALEIDPNNTYAQKLKAKLDSGKKLSGLELSRLVGQNESTMVEKDTSSIREATAKRLTELGETADVNALASALAKQVSGKKLTVSEKSLIKNSTYGRQVANELNPENVRAAQGDQELWSAFYDNANSEWVEKIGTNKINAEEYGRLLAELEAEKPDQQVTGKLPATTEETTVVETPTVASEDFTDEAKAVDVTENVPQAVEATEDENEAVEATEAEEESPLTLEDASKKYGAQAGAMLHTYTAGQDVARYDAAYQMAYNMGKSGVALSYVMDNEATAYLSESQRMEAVFVSAGIDTVCCHDHKGKCTVEHIESVLQLFDTRFILILTRFLDQMCKNLGIGR